MISERDIAEKFSAIWKQSFPLLTSNFVRVFNEAKVKVINTKTVVATDEMRFDLVSEAAFNLSEIVITQGVTVPDYLCSENNISDLLEKTAKVIWTKGDYVEEDIKLSSVEFQDILRISENVIEFIGKVKKNSIQFRPKLKGFGFMPDLQADLSIDDTLYEVKTVNRNFKSNDLKQLFIYLALKQASDGGYWKYAGLYNPRKGTFCKFNIKSLVYNLTGGKTPNETFETLLTGLVRDIEVDTQF